MINTLLDKPPSLEVWCGRSRGRWARHRSIRARAEVLEWLSAFDENDVVRFRLHGRVQGPERVMCVTEMRAWAESIVVNRRRA
jgi:hypothetical protein